MAVGAGVSPVVDVAPVEEGVVLAVGHDELMKSLGGLHGKAHLRLALHTSPVVGEGRHIGGQSRQVRQLLPQLATDAKSAEKARLAAEAKIKEERAAAIAEKKAAAEAAAREAAEAAAAETAAEEAAPEAPAAE